MKTNDPQVKESGSPSGQSAMTLSTDGARTDLEHVTLRWDNWSHSPIFYTNDQITFYENGDWEVSCNAADHSEHSDWDVTATYSLISTATGAIIAELGGWFQDLDHGENFNKTASGNNSEVRSGFIYIKNGSYSANHHSHIIRDN